MTKPRTLTAIAASAALLFVLTGCGSDDSKKASVDLPAANSSTGDSSATTDDAPAAATGLTKDNFIAEMLKAMREKKTAHMEMELGSSISASADIRYADDATDMDMKMSVGAQEQRLIVTGGAVYMQMPGGDKFTKVDSSDPALSSLLDQMTSMGPESSVKAMEAGLQDVADKGEESVGGEKLHHYVVTVDSSAAADSLGSAGESAGQLPDKLTYDMWVDGANLMRRVVMEVMGQKIVMNVSGWGESVDIKAPAAADIVTQ